jgi:hypothetical protein
VSEESVSWERLPGESSRAFHGYVHYRDLGAARSLDKAWREHKERCDHQPDHRRVTKRWATWSVDWGWVQRSEAYDQSLDRLSQSKHKAAQLAAVERHAKLAQAILTSLSAPIRSFLDGLKDPAVLAQLTARMPGDPGAVLQLLAVIVRAAQVAPGIVAMERLALGLSEDAFEVEAHRDTGFADAVAKDPEAVQLAVRLLDRIAGTGAGAALGAGAPSESWPVADGAAPEPPDGTTH